jgi:hypothetical protein
MKLKVKLISHAVEADRFWRVPALMLQIFPLPQL